MTDTYTCAFCGGVQGLFGCNPYPCCETSYTQGCEGTITNENGKEYNYPRQDMDEGDDEGDDEDDDEGDDQDMDEGDDEGDDEDDDQDMDESDDEADEDYEDDEDYEPDEADESDESDEDYEDYDDEECMDIDPSNILHHDRESTSPQRFGGKDYLPGANNGHTAGRPIDPGSY